MSKYLGDFSAADVIDFKFTTFRPSTGAPFTLAGSPVVSVYKDNDLTQTTTGVALTVDFDSEENYYLQNLYKLSYHEVFVIVIIGCCVVKCLQKKGRRM